MDLHRDSKQKTVVKNTWATQGIWMDWFSNHEYFQVFRLTLEEVNERKFTKNNKKEKKVRSSKAKSISDMDLWNSHEVWNT